LIRTLGKTHRRAQSKRFGRNLLHDIGLRDEWHLVFAKSFCHFMFQFPSWFEHPLDFLVSSFIHSRFDSVWAVGDSVCGDGVE
jgi:hypothetical protein